MSSPEDTDGFLSYEEAYQWLIEHNVPASKWEDLESLVELNLLNKSLRSNTDNDAKPGSNASSGPIPKSQELMQHILAHDKQMKEELTEIYLEIIKFMENSVNAEIQETIECRYIDYKEKIAGYQSELSNHECPIVVAGETSAGKSSLLNLILGTEVLPYSLLCATSTICRLHNDTTTRLVVDGKEEHNVESTEALTDALRHYVSGRDNKGDNEVNQVDIYRPIPMLPKNVTIVDTPGFGESDKMNDRLMKYLPNAVAFIYVINSATAGGIQEDKLLHILNKQKEWDGDNQLFSFDYKCIMFVCNKWDQVEKTGEEAKVWEDTTRKLKGVFPELPMDQVFKMCTTKALQYQKSGLGNTEKFDRLLQGIEKMVPQSLKTKLNRHYRWIEKFIGQVQTVINARISHAQTSEEKKARLHTDVTTRLNKLNIDAERVKATLVEKAREKCDTIVKNLHQYVHSEEVSTYLCDWKDSDAPDVITDFEVTRYNAEKKIRTRLQDVLKKWENENKQLETVSGELTTMFTTECRLLGKDCKGIDLMIEGGANVFEQEGMTPTQEKTQLFTGSERVILLIAAPLWVPLVAAASLVFLPVGLGMIIKEKVTQNNRISEYKANKTSFMIRWTKEMTEKAFTEECLSEFISEAYFKQFEAKIEELCSDFIPKQIELDRKMINDINEDRRTSQEILESFLPMQKKLKTVLGHLYMYRLRYEKEDSISQDQIEKGRKLGSGSFSDVYEAYWTVDGTRMKIALKELRYELKGDTIYTQLKEVESLRSLKHDNIVEFHGVSYGNDDGATGNENATNSRNLIGGKLSLLFEYCEDNLENIVFNDETKQCGHYNSVESRQEAFKFYVAMSVGICIGLAYIHEKKYMHRDLKLANVLVKGGTIPKICDFGFTKEEYISSGTFVGTKTHMSPELFNGRHYTHKTDIYSLAITLWELWYGRHAFDDGQFARYQGKQLWDVIAAGARPNTTSRFAMTPGMSEIVQSCWQKDPAERMEAAQVCARLQALA